MTLHLEISGEVEQLLIARASDRGVSVEHYVQELIAREAQNCSVSRNVSADGKARDFRRWAESFPPDLPVLSVDDVSRERIYRRD